MAQALEEKSTKMETIFTKGVTRMVSGMGLEDTFGRKVITTSGTSAKV